MKESSACIVKLAMFLGGRADARGGIRMITWAGGGAFPLRSNGTKPEGTPVLILPAPPRFLEKPWADRAVRGGNAGRANANAAELAHHKNKLPT